ncbi:3'(2'),5'-bisphosphate nucleotidase CysQ [Paraglaciecola chathamensis]|jgi:3'(2'), 5'-bisphosphate nucleotidase|uniref:3'(2'),5'-bisphosphate nucleotidase CysQ n=3 Tax=Paraglaciecola chathamensis TaxID=368405 RepID=A0ABS0WE32_9ALTE|nr:MULTISPECIES: 3'(2'),5'-bisphosphate nucleotidase CysQ [Paraglaciecola]AEE25094.1 3'(2'),5'-bisphosphate nucleotidase [Glaciecola sp. 4H-3-7+YE-5]MBN27541.1 3'(2'),5'-bisphosphate nucleotidase [Alteromonadaceae bacterium]MBJ2136725.1 3'(2'),5'-bisphosphate nucleotidase CysQ [Paraglaciecola chathamensis]MBU3017771.1 3'(2'),5'-bisphosphate nucleotidase CysQ [Paraglaciecola agarilytica]MDO6560169.1 3'(2'),5'-bisphosphate nucleotidase CysQ [Paraglaciecola chathamensis]|tara:strand:+ start:256 stop:1092 length:837 start_codon:yes stop_codon:yes gene_type:complete
MPTDSISSLLDIAKSAAQAAGKVVMEIYDSGDYKSYQKDDDSPVTSADYKANEVILAILKRKTPHIPIMSEESDNGALDERKDWHRYWLIDPIDGTQEFIARSGDFAVNIALVEDNQPVIGVIYWPPGETLYFASKGHGAFKESRTENKRIHVRKFDDPEQDPVMIAISRRQARENVMRSMSDHRTYQTYPTGSCSLKSCFIAEGKADVFLRLGVTGEWDTGASQCIVSEAGGNILAHDFSPLSYNERNSVTNPDFIVMGDQRVNWQTIVKYTTGDTE